MIAEDHIVFWKFYFSRTWYRLDVAALGDAQAHLPAGDLVSGDFEETAGISRLLWFFGRFCGALNFEGWRILMHEVLSVWLHASFHPAGQPLSFSDPRSSGSQRHPREGHT